MAKATKKVSITSVNLELDLLEATVLKNLLSKIGGCPRTSARQVTERIHNSLVELNLPGIPKEITEVKNNSLYYRDDTLDIIKEVVDKHEFSK